jgi:hypothetical protein
MSVSAPLTRDPGVAAEMAEEGRRIVDAATTGGLTLRLLGGLAVRDHCEVLDFCGRDHSDLDMVGLRAEAQQLGALFAELGYAERLEVREATLTGQAQFVRRCVHAAADGSRAHAEDHVDVFLDVFRMDHTLDLRRRLSLEPYTISSADLLLTKLQIARFEAKDVRDVLTLLKDVQLADGPVAGAIDVAYIAALCAHDWGLWYDVTTNLRRCRAELETYGLEAAERDRLEAAVARLTAAIDGASKPLAWKLRAKVGTRVPWHAFIEEQDGASPNE